MAKNNTLTQGLQLAVIGLVGLIGYDWAKKQSPGSTAKDVANTVGGLLGGHPASPQSGGAPTQSQGSPQSGGGQPAGPPQAGKTPTGIPLNSNGRVLNLWDFGGVQVQFFATQNNLCQYGGQNCYGQGDTFYDGDGNSWTWFPNQDVFQSAAGVNKVVEDFYA